MRFWLFLAVALPLFGCDTDPVIDPVEVSYDPPGVHLVMGNPSNAVSDAGTPDNFLIQKNEFALGYNNSLGAAMWVSWHLSPQWRGGAERQDDFRPDPDLPTGFFKANSSSYTGTGFDRGHQCPSEDRDGSISMNSATFVMTNMLPQAPNVNQDCWVKMENYLRSLVNGGDEIYIISGGYGVGGSGNNGGTTNHIANGSITVPKRLWKIAVVVSLGADDLDRVTTDTRVIAIDVANMQSAGAASWGTRRVSVRSIETATGFNFLSNLPTAIQDVIENKVDDGPIN